MVTGKPYSFETNAGKGLVSHSLGHPRALAAGTTEGLNKDDRSCENQALSAREFPKFFSGLKNYSHSKNKESGRRGG